MNSDFDYIGKFWDFGEIRYGKNLEKVLRHLTEVGCRALGAYELNTHKLVSWFLFDLDGHGLIGHTLPDYRRYGVFAWLLLDSIERGSFMQFNGKAVGYTGLSNTYVLEKSIQMGAITHEKLCLNFLVKASKCDENAKL